MSSSEEVRSTLVLPISKWHGKHKPVSKTSIRYADENEEFQRWNNDSDAVSIEGTMNYEQQSHKGNLNLFYSLSQNLKMYENSQRYELKSKQYQKTKSKISEYLSKNQSNLAGSQKVESLAKKKSLNSKENSMSSRMQNCMFVKVDSQQPKGKTTTKLHLPSVDLPFNGETQSNRINLKLGSCRSNSNKLAPEEWNRNRTSPQNASEEKKDLLQGTDRESDKNRFKNQTKAMIEKGKTLLSQLQGSQRFQSKPVVISTENKENIEYIKKRKFRIKKATMKENGFQLPLPTRKGKSMAVFKYFSKDSPENYQLTEDMTQKLAQLKGRTQPIEKSSAQKQFGDSNLYELNRLSAQSKSLRI